MKGILLDFSIKDNIGYISGNDGNRYEFVGKEWREDVLPMKGDIVDFDIDVDGKAIKIYSVIQSTLNANKTESFEITEEYTRQLEGEKSYGTMS